MVVHRARYLSHSARLLGFLRTDIHEKDEQGPLKVVVRRGSVIKQGIARIKFLVVLSSAAARAREQEKK